jgi:nicotinamidase-related amidase
MNDQTTDKHVEHSRLSMPKSAVLLMDLQRDFLDLAGGRMPVDATGAAAVLQVANKILSKCILAGALPILVMNQFPATARIGNFFRKGSAIAGTAGAKLDDRLQQTGSENVIAKASASAFSNPELEQVLRANSIQEIYVLGVFAEGCVRATVVDAVKRGYSVYVIADAVATNAAWKKRFALWAMKRAGAKILPSALALEAADPGVGPHKRQSR